MENLTIPQPTVVRPQVVADAVAEMFAEEATALRARVESLEEDREVLAVMVKETLTQLAQAKAQLEEARRTIAVQRLARHSSERPS